MSRGWMHSADVSIQSVLYLAARDVTTGTVSWTALRRRLRRLALCSAATYTCSLIICRNHTTNTATDTQVLVKDNTVAKNYTKVKVEHTHTHTHTHTQPFNGPLSRTTWVGRHQKKHSEHSPTHTHPDHQTSFINFLHLLRSIYPPCSILLTFYLAFCPFRD